MPSSNPVSPPPTTRSSTLSRIVIPRRYPSALPLGAEHFAADGDRLCRYQYESDNARLRSAIDPIVDCAALHQHIACLEVDCGVVERHINLARHDDGVID